MRWPRGPGRPGSRPSTGIEPVLSFVGLDDIRPDNSALGLASGPEEGRPLPLK